MWMFVALACGAPPCGNEGGLAAIVDAPTAADASAAAPVLQKRLDQWGVLCADVRPEGAAIRLFLPAVADTSSLDALLSDPHLEFLPTVPESAFGGVALVEGTPEGPRTHLVDYSRGLRDPDVRSAEVTTDRDTGQEYVALVLGDGDRARFAALTAANVGRVMVITLDDRVLSAPMVQEAITGGRLSIVVPSGGAHELAAALALPPLPSPLTLRSVEIRHPGAVR